MNIQIYIKKRDDTCNATALFDGEYITVLKGSFINQNFASHVRGGRTAKRYRENPEYVNSEGMVIRDCVFKSPSTAAQFVVGGSVNGWLVWHVDRKTSLREYIDSIGGE